MKNFLPGLLLVLCFTNSCLSKDYTLFPGKGREKRLNGVDPGSGKKERHSADSVLYFCGVEYPEGYEWRKDTTGTVVSGDLVLFADFNPILRLKTGPDREISDDHDMHHLIGGHLYTEYCSSDHTIIKCDGKDIVRYQGREYLRGLLIEGEKIYTLGQNRQGEGFSLRCNGNPIVIKNSGTVDGGFGFINFDGNGALFKDDGKIAFRYTSNGKFYTMEDGIETPGTSISFADDHHISAYQHKFLTFIPMDDMPLIIYTAEHQIMLDGELLDGDYYFFPPEGAFCTERDWYLAVTPIEKGAKPAILTRSGMKILDFNGFVTGVEVLVHSPGDGP